MTDLLSATTPLTVLSAADIGSWIRLAAQAVTDHTEELTKLDAAIGDADHGTNMRRGLAAVVTALDEGEPDTPAAVLKKVAMTLVSQVGGASGPLYGTFFLRMSTAVGGVTELDAAALADAVEAGVDGIKARGRGETGEKTMLDAWCPALSALREHPSSLEEATAVAAQAAAAGREDTRGMTATKGRASYLGERSVGHLDPGAASTALILRALAQTVHDGHPGCDQGQAVR